MSNNRDDQKKDPLRAGDPKRPHATLDLKAVEIKTAEQKAAEAKSTSSTGSGAATAATSGSAATGAASSATSSAASSASAAKTAADSSPSKGQTPLSGKSDTTKADAGSGGKTAGSSAGASSAASAKMPPPQPAQSSGGFGRFVSHTVAGLVGGFLALLGADTLTPQLEQLGLPVHSASNEATQQLNARIAELEKSSKAAAQGGEGAKLSEAMGAVTAKLAALEKLNEQVAALSAEQDKLKGETQTLVAKAAEAPAAGGSGIADPRIAKLEEQLSMLASASSGGSAGAAVPQLAAVTGKLSDLESTLENQMAALRKSVGEEIDSRMGKAAETAEAARSGTQRIDRELADVKTEATRLGQRMEALKADGERVSDTLRVVQEETGKLTSGLDALKGDLAARFKAAAKPDDISSAIAPVSAKVAALEQSVHGVVTAEDNRKANAERIVLSLELANLKRVIDRGLGFAEELAQVKKAAGSKINLAGLEPYKMDGVPTLADLQAGFRPLAFSIIAAAEDSGDGGVLDRLMSGARSVVRVRKVNHNSDDDGVEAVVGRMDSALSEGRIGDFQALSQKLSDKARAPAGEFLKKVAARNAVDQALREIEGQLKSSLSGEGAPAAPAAIQ
ncbi:MAG: hypothetical protein KDJ47_05700 [Hyphomicrobiaceae bacterium]|nr:hypothetical protein [Hyphomicrobiaceae bacterium]